ncbi:MAG: hypothetical protein O3C67_10970 [Cyanobacteria bacterium]|nr:hypothetical protein [Cyanobacteriota bacterium]MEB3267932.1 hypothetical protein [Leptolyngbya sp.]
MKRTFTTTLREADGRYLSDNELDPLETYWSSFAIRAQTYQLLRDQADTLVLQALRRLAQTQRATVQTHGQKCQRDMAYALSCIAKAVLTDEAQDFQEDFALWMENITHALHKGESAAQAYGFLKQAIQAQLPETSAQLVMPYLDDLIMAFSNPR